MENSDNSDKMGKVPRKQKKAHNLPREKLLLLTREELADRILQLEIHNMNLKNIISKSSSSNSQTPNEKVKREFDFTRSNYRRILLHVAYLGWDYHGFVVQEDTANTIEHHLFNALIRTCLVESRETSQYHRCGRTDKGVSAYGQVISILIRSKLTEPVKTSDGELPYCQILNRLLPKDIRAVGWMPIPGDQPEFSARFDCTRRQYKYYFPRGTLNVPSMRDACRLLVGNHDYRNFCKMDVGNGVVEFHRTVLNADIVAVNNDDHEPTSMYYLLIEGNAFLWHQIRCTMAILLLIGSGKETKDIITQLFNCEEHPRKPQYHMAIDLPLNLFQCSYDLGTDWIYDAEELKKVISDLQAQWTTHNIKATMIKDSIQDLENKYKKTITNPEDSTNEEHINAYADCLTMGVSAKEYIPLLKREKCPSLEERIKHYTKRRKLPQTEDTSQ